MALTSDYFLLYHGIHFEVAAEQQTLSYSSAEKERLQNFALLLTISRKAFDKFSILASFENLCQSVHVKTPKELSALHALQYEIIKALTTEYRSEDFNILLDTFVYLENEEILQKENYKKLLSLFTIQENRVQVENSVKVPFSFPKAKQSIFDSIKKLEILTEDVACGDDVKIFLNAQKFSIGITGVMNAGKSTLINALMGEEVLGTSVVPETANLTLLQYSKNPSATVVYWNQREWQNIVKAVTEIKAMQDFVEETEETFSNDFDNYVQEVSKREKIAIDALPLYTSAAESNKKCNLVKHVELQTDLSFLKEGVEIVDTPGLDDPVIQREEITKGYIASCDMLLHLMNVSQSATQTDVAFIVDALLYQNISKVLIVITRADTVSQSELDEVIAYTKQSITEELTRVNKANRLDSILETLDFIAVSGKMALLCRTDPEEAKTKEYSLEKSGILALESRLNETLFGSNAEKSRLLITSAQKKLAHQIEEKKSVLHYRLELLAKSQEELSAQWLAFLKYKEETEEKSEQMEEDLRYDEEQLRASVRSLEHFVHSEFYALQTVLRERVVSDVRYSVEKTKKLPEASRIEVIVETAFKDGMIDIVRDYRYKLSQKFEALDENYRLKYKNAGFESHEIFEAESFFANAFQHGFLTQNIEIFIRQILAAVKHTKAKEITRLDAEVQEIVIEMLKPIETETKMKLEALSRRLIEQYREILKRPLLKMKQKLQSEEESLRYYKEYHNTEDNDSSALHIHEKIKKLEEIENELRGAADVS